MKIDVHTHILPAQIPDFASRFGVKGFIRLQECPGCTDLDMVTDEGKFFRRIDRRCFDPDHRVKDLEQLGVNQQALSTLPVMFSYWTHAKHGAEICQFLNDHLLEVQQQHPARFYVLGSVPLQDTDLAVRELERIMQSGAAGVQIGSNVNGMNLSDRRFDEFWRACETMGAAVFVHPWNMMGQERMPDYWLPWLVGMPAESSLAICSLIFGGVFDRFPQLRVAIAHGGGSFPFTLGRIEHGHRSRPDLVAKDNPNSPRDYLKRFFVDSLVHDTQALLYLVDLFGEDQIVLGSDYPFPLGEDRPGQLVEASLPEKARDQILYRNALRFLKGE